MILTQIRQKLRSSISFLLTEIIIDCVMRPVTLRSALQMANRTHTHKSKKTNISTSGLHKMNHMKSHTSNGEGYRPIRCEEMRAIDSNT